MPESALYLRGLRINGDENYSNLMTLIEFGVARLRGKTSVVAGAVGASNQDGRTASTWGRNLARNLNRSAYIVQDGLERPIYSHLRSDLPYSPTEMMA